MRVPYALLQSRAHSASAVLLYAVTDLLPEGYTLPWLRPGAHPGTVTTGRRRPVREPGDARTVTSSQPWLARRIGLSVSGLQAALAALSRPHTGDGLGRQHPPYLTTTHRYGRRQGGTGVVRAVAPCDSSYTEVPAWSTGDERGPLVDPVAWRLYVATVKHRDPQTGGTICRLTAGELAEVIRVRRQAIPGLLERLRVAGLVVTVESPRKPTLILPLMVPVESDEHRAALADEMATACGYLPADWRTAWASDGGSHGPQTVVDLGLQTGVSEETHLLGDTVTRHKRRGRAYRGRPQPPDGRRQPDRPRLTDPMPVPDPPRLADARWAPPNAEYRDIRAQLAARQDAKRAAAVLAARSTTPRRRRPQPPTTGFAEAG